MTACVFCKIIKNELFAHKIFEDDNFLVILDAFPSILGQVLVIPKKHSMANLFDLNKKDYGEVLLITKRVARAIQNALKPIKVGLVVDGLEIEHLHLKLFPLTLKGLILKPLTDKPSEGIMKALAKKISDSF